RLFMMKLAIDRDPHARSYMDPALTPVDSDDDATLDLLTKTTGATTAVAHIKKVATLTGAGRGRSRSPRAGLCIRSRSSSSGSRPRSVHDRGLQGATPVI